MRILLTKKTNVWINVTVLRDEGNRSYFVQTEDGATLRRSRRFLRLGNVLANDGKTSTVQITALAQTKKRRRTEQPRKGWNQTRTR